MEPYHAYNPPDFKPETGWEPVKNLARIGGAREFVVGKRNAHVLQVSYFTKRDTGDLVGKTWFLQAVHAH